MSLNNRQVIERTNIASTKLLKEKGYISTVDVLIEMGKLTEQDYENWRFRKVPYLEKVIKVNMSKINVILRAIQEYSQGSKLKPSKAIYKSWGKGPKRLLRFSKYGERNVEEAYSTHYIKPNDILGKR
jgi:hypothetical protein